MAGYGGHSFFCFVLFLQCGNHSQTGFWDYKRYLLDPVCIFIVFVNSVMTPFLNVLGMFTPPALPFPLPPVRNLQELSCVFLFFFHCSFLFSNITFQKWHFGLQEHFIMILMFEARHHLT